VTDWKGMFIPRRLTQRPQPFESLATPAVADVAQLEELRAGGSRLELPHPVRAFVRFRDEAGARSAMDAMERDGFATRIRAEQDGSWTVTAVYTLIPTPGGITKIRELLVAAAEPYDGRYLGWQAPLVY
jgi:hypothetical protein